MSCDISACKDSVSNKSFYQSIRLENYTGRDVYVRLAILKTDANGKPVINARGVYQVSSTSGESVLVAPSLGTGGGQYGIVGGFTDPYNGFIATTTDGQFAGVISRTQLNVDTSCCADYWVSIGLKSKNATVLVNSAGTTMDKPNAFYLLPSAGGLKNAHRSSMRPMVILLLLLLLVAVVAAVGYYIYRRNK